MGLGAVELIMSVEEAFDIEIPDREAEELSTVGQMYAYIINSTAFPRRWDPNAAWETLRSIIVQQFGVPPEAIAADTDFVRDLGAD